MKDAARFALVGLMPGPLRRRWMERRYQRDVAGSGEAELKHLRTFLKRGDLAIDIGCNIGDYAFELGRLTGRVVAFEPNPYLHRFVSGLGLKGVDLRQIALSDAAGTARLNVPAASGGHGLGSLRANGVAPDEAETFEVRTERLDDLGFSDVAFIKIDVEGFEEAVLDGAAATIARDRPGLLIEIEERHNAGGFARIRTRLEGLGYAGYFLRDDAWTPIDRFDLKIDQREAGPDETAALDRHYVNNFLFLRGDRSPAWMN